MQGENMKKTIIAILLILTAMQAAPLTQNMAAETAVRFTRLHQLNVSIDPEICTTVLSADDQTTLAYIFDAASGFIAVAADDRLEPVIAFSEDKQPGESGLGLFRCFLRADLTKRLNNYNSQSGKAKALIRKAWDKLSAENLQPERYEQWPAAGTTTTGGWTITKWKQEAPYNKFCPMDKTTNQRSVTGCPSTAMGQILNYHRTTNHTKFLAQDRYFHNYTNQYWVDDDWAEFQFLSFEQLNIYLDSIETKYASGRELTSDEKAALSLACGFACKTVYSSAGSGTFGVNQAYDAYVKFGFQGLTFMDSAFSDDEIRNKMIENIKIGLPVHLATVNEAWNSGHNVVCDGYRDNGYFRLNMGWGGSADNWYSLPQGFPYSLTVFEGIVADINRNVSIGNNKLITNMMTTSYPNPFNNSCQITFQQSAAAEVSLTVFDLQGREVRKLATGKFSAGQHSFAFNADNLSAGVYFYRLQSGINIVSHKILLVK